MLAVICIGLLVLTLRSFVVADEVNFSYTNVVQAKSGEQTGFKKQALFAVVTSIGGLVVMLDDQFHSDGFERKLGFAWGGHHPMPTGQMPPEERRYPGLSIFGRDAKLVLGVDWLGYGTVGNAMPEYGLTAYMPQPTRVAIIPLPLLTGLTAIIPALWLRGWHRRRSLDRRGLDVEPAETSEAPSPSA